MKWIILFKGAVETQEFFSVEMAKTFEQKGYQIYWYDLMLQEESARILTDFVKEHQADQIVAFTFNFNGIAGEKGLYEETYGWNFWNEFQIPVYNMVVDHPLYYHKYEKMIPKQYWQISIDRNHVRYLNRYCPQITQLGDSFIPLGGTELPEVAQNGRIPIGDRKIDVIFTGNYTPLSQLDHYLSGMGAEYIELYHDLVSEAIDNPDSLIEDLAEKRLKKEIGQLTDMQLKACMPNMMYVDLCVRFYYRAKVIQTLIDQGVKVSLFGAGWELLECKHPENMILHGNVNSQKCLDMIAQSKISLNVMPWFKDGAHDRIFNSMLNGAVSVTDDSIWLRQQFVDNKNIVFYDLKQIESLPSRIMQLLDNTSELQAISDQAYDTCKKQHTWGDRAQQICDFIDNKITN